MNNHEATKDTKQGIEFDELSRRVIGCALEVHRALGPGLLESVYQQCLARELAMAGVPFKSEVSLPVEYKGVQLDCGYRLDFVVDGELIVELKAVDKLLPVHEAQLLTYMKVASVPVGLLINFNVPLIKQGIKRFVL